MPEPRDPELTAELQELYSALHHTCGRASSLLRLSSVNNAPIEELLEQFRAEESRAAAIWRRIAEIQGF